MPLFLNNRQRMVKGAWEELERRGNRLLTLVSKEECEVSLTLVSNKRIRTLNRDFRHKDKSTDVLSFPMEEEDTPPGFPRVLGDVIISVETALKQSEERANEPGGNGYGLLDEMTFLLIHGVLHLMGYDHLEDQEAEEMEAEELRLFLHFGSIPPRLHHEVR